MNTNLSPLAGFAIAILLTTQAVFAQGPGQGGGPGGGPGQQNRMPPGGPPPVSPLLKALDTNGDGVLSAAEIANAATALKTLDKNGDGVLSAEEMRPAFGSGGPEMMGLGGPGGPGGPGGGGPTLSTEQTLERYLTLDKNGDGQLTKNEVPTRMQTLFTRADTNKDGVLTKDELTAIIAKEATARTAQPQGMGGPGGFGGPGGGPPPR